MASSVFQVLKNDPTTQARTGVLQTPHGEIRTPVFMPVGTQATVKTLTSAEMEIAGAQIILSNTYHLYLRPGAEVIREAGGLHPFMAWRKPILTDSGGFQIFSLAQFVKIKEDGVEFKSHLDGSRHFLTPESVVDIQLALGSDILMPLDECVRYPVERKVIEESAELTLRWAERSWRHWSERTKDRQSRPLHFGIVQGGTDARLRKKSARDLAALGFPGYALGGLSVGEPPALMTEMVGVAVAELPVDKPRYLMGVGFPVDLFEAVSQGIDMFDCVVPTRNGRNATVFTHRGKLLLRGASYTRDFRPIDESCPCYACRTHTRAYLRHLFNTEEHLAGRLASLHNVTFFIQLLDFMRRAIEEGRFAEFRREFERDFSTP